MKNDFIYYSVGALLYCPANNIGIADSIISGKFGDCFSLALCLEDTIGDSFVEEAETIMIASIQKIREARENKIFYIPKIFIRVRNSAQIIALMNALGENMSIVTGFIIPKFSRQNATEYIQEIIKANELAGRPVYAMPIYESSDIIDLRTRYDALYELKDSLTKIEDRILNIRVGGNDLCNIFGFRRRPNESIHDIKPVSSIFSDIITVYGTEYVISGPVWEYYSGEGWDTGLINEIKGDKLCGFVGKTVIHPNQISVVNSAYRVENEDYFDALAILDWKRGDSSYVSTNTLGRRMNEYKTHLNWAEKTLYMARQYSLTHMIKTDED